MGQRPDAPGSCVDCGNDAYIRLSSSNGANEMICGHCYAERTRKDPVVPRNVGRVDPDLKLPRLR